MSSLVPQGQAPTPFRPLTLRVIVVSAAFAIAVTVAMAIFLWDQADVVASAAERAQLQIDAIRTALAVGVGAGGFAALLLTARRQWVHEKEHMLQSDIAKKNEYDASERRVTDLYTKAVDQLANENAAVRVGALYSLERLGDAYPKHRQTIVDLICGYLRIRKDLPDQKAGTEQDAADRSDPLWIPGREESEVRATAQEILRAHLTDPGDHQETYSNRPQREPWSDMRLDLHGAKLENFALDYADVLHLDFRDAEFWGTADFGAANIRGRADFARAIFRGEADFINATFSEPTYFTNTQFCERADFYHASFPNAADFTETVFWESLSLNGIRVGPWDMAFHGSEFFGPVYLQYSKLGNAILLEGCIFRSIVNLFHIEAPDGMVRLNRAIFYDFVDFGNRPQLLELHGAKAYKEATVRIIEPDGWTLDADEPGEFAVFLSEEREITKARRKVQDGKSIKPVVREAMDRRYFALIEELGKLIGVGGKVTVGDGALEVYSPNRLEDAQLDEYRARAELLGYRLVITDEPDGTDV